MPEPTEKAPDAVQPAATATEAALPPVSTSQKDIEALDEVFNNPPAEETPAGDQPPPVEPPKEEPKEAPKAEEPPAGKEKILPHRVSTSQFTPTEQRAIALAKEFEAAGETVPSLRDRIDMIERRDREAQAAEEAERAAAAEPPKPSESETLAAQLGDIDQKISAAEENGDTAEALKLTRQRSDVALAHDRALRSEGEARNHYRSQVEEGRAASKAEAVKMFPSSADDSTPMGQEVQNTLRALRNPKHPDHEILYTVNAPMRLAQMAAHNLAQRMAQEQGIGFGEAYASLLAKPEVVPPPVPAKKVNPGTAAPAPPATKAPAKLGDPRTYTPADDADIEESMPGGHGVVLRM